MKPLPNFSCLFFFGLGGVQCNSPFWTCLAKDLSCSLQLMVCATYTWKIHETESILNKPFNAMVFLYLKVGFLLFSSNCKEQSKNRSFYKILCSKKNDFCKGPSVYRGCGSNGANLYLDDIFDVNYIVYLNLFV